MPPSALLSYGTAARGDKGRGCDNSINPGNISLAILAAKAQI